MTICPIVRVLMTIKGGVRIEIENSSGMSIFYVGCITSVTDELWLSAQAGDCAKVIDLVENGGDCTVKEGRTQCSPLHIACLMGHENVVNCLLKYHKIPSSLRILEEVDSQGLTPIFYACGGIQPRIVKTLIEYGADIQSSIENIHSANATLRYHTESDYADVPCKWRWRLIDIAAGACIYTINRNNLVVSENVRGLNKEDARLPVLENGQLEVIKILLEKGVVVEQTTLSGLADFHHTVWRSAIENRHDTALLELLLNERPISDIPARRDGSSIVHEVAGLEPDRCKDDRDTRMLCVLIAHGFDIFQKNTRGETPMHNAVRSHNYALLRCFYPLLIATQEDSQAILVELCDIATTDTWIEMEIIMDDVAKDHSLAFAMGLQRRLGVGSRVLALTPDLLRLVLERVLGRVE